MTQDVEPLTWQKRTNLEEHQQFFSKINEIIANLAPTVDEAEAAIADANAAIATANAASAAASAAASQAQTAASTVAGYDGRLTAVEGEADTNAGNITALQGRMGTAEGNITALGTRMTAAESKNTQQDTAIAAIQTKNNQQDTAIGALQTADAQNVKINSIAQYALTLTDNQQFAGIKTALNFPVKNQRVSAQNEEGWHLMYEWNAGNTTANQIIVFLVRYKQQTNGFGILLVDIRSTNAAITWLLKGSGVPDDTVIVARKYSNNTAYLYLSGYRLEAECWGCSRATSVNPVEVIMSSDPETAVTEPTTADFDTVVKI